jgi:hypothetical protein
MTGSGPWADAWPSGICKYHANEIHLFSRYRQIQQRCAFALHEGRREPTFRSLEPDAARTAFAAMQHRACAGRVRKVRGVAHGSSRRQRNGKMPERSGSIPNQAEGAAWN